MNTSLAPDLILHRGLFTTLDHSNPTASAVAIKDGKFTGVGLDKEILPLAPAKPQKSSTLKVSACCRG